MIDPFCDQMGTFIHRIRALWVQLCAFIDRICTFCNKFWTKYERVRAIFGPDGGFMDMIGYLGTYRSIYGQDRYILEPDGTNYGWVRTILGPDGYDQFGNR